MIVQDAVTRLAPRTRRVEALEPDFSHLPSTLEPIEEDLHDRIAGAIPEWVPGFVRRAVVSRVDFGEVVGALVDLVNELGLRLPDPLSNEPARRWLLRALNSIEKDVEAFSDRWVAELLGRVAMPWWLRILGAGKVLEAIAKALIPDLVFKLLRRQLAEA